MTNGKYSSRIKALLRSTERMVQALIVEAGQAAEYDVVPLLAAVARDVSRLAEQIDSSHTPGGMQAPSELTRKPSSPPKKSKTSRRRKGRRSRNYPKFFRDGGKLLKVGWSKRKKKEYRHRAPGHLATALARAIAEAGGEDVIVPTEEFFPLQDPNDHSEIPNYQAYIVLAWLVTSGVVRKHGRQGYTVSDPYRLSERIEEEWKALPTASG